MAFNLNKNEGSQNNLSSKNSGSSSFNLSKQEVRTTTPTKQSSKTKTWLIGLAGIILLAAGIWYYSSSKKESNNVQDARNDSAKTALPKTEATDNQVNIPLNTSDTAKSSDKIVAQKNTPSSRAETVAALDHKIPVTFVKGSSTFMNIDQSLIKQIIAYLKTNPTAAIQVNGYASSDGPLSLNQAISQARADAFKQFLISKNIVANRISALGKGIENPIASNKSNQGRKRNRRIEVIFP